MKESLTYSVLTTFDSQEAIRETWDPLSVKLGSPIYMSYDWVRLWWRFYGAGSALRVFIFSQDNSWVAIVPIYISSLGLGPARIRVARLVGSNIPPKVFNPPVPREISREVWGAVIHRLLGEDQCDILSLGPLCETYPAFAGLEEAVLNGNSTWTPAKEAEREVHTTYVLPKSFEEFFASLDGKERKVRRKKLRDLEAKGSVRVDVVEDPAAVGAEFDSFVRQHTTQWEAEGRPGHFHAWPQALDYNRELVKAQGQLGRVRFIRLLVGDQVVANQYNFAFGRGLYAELPARLAGAEWERLSLGCSSQVKLLETAIQRGFEIMESGLGHYDYKVSLGGKECDVRCIRIAARRGGSRMRIAAYSALRTCMRYGYHKMWYRRISPKMLRSNRRPQWASWLRLDF